MKKVFVFSLLLSFFMVACVSAHVNPKRIDPAAFPPEFKDPDCVLLLQKRTHGINAKGMNNYLKKSFKKYYKGKYEMASLEEINSDPKYQDKKIYRYVLTDEVWRNNQTVRTTTTVTNGASTSSQTDFQYNNAYRIGYHLHDRLEEKPYPEIGVSSNVPAKAMKRVASVLNSQLTK